MRSKLARAAVELELGGVCVAQVAQGAGQNLAGVRRLVGDVNLRPHADPSAKVFDRVFGPGL